LPVSRPDFGVGLTFGALEIGKKVEATEMFSAYKTR
jgi:hypothetical protein